MLKNAQKNNQGDQLMYIQKLKLKFFATAAMLIPLGLFSQNVTIASPDFNTCESTFNDTNPIGQYADNENETITVCADGDPILNFYFIGFDLGEGDVLEFFDGNSTAAPSLGAFTGTDLANQNVTSTNPEGCLTLQWTSDASGVGDFGAIISCGPPCNHPIISSTIVGDEGNPLLLCVGEEFTLDASGTIFIGDAILESFVWDFGDDNLNTTSWPQVTHSFSEPGSYVLTLQVIDSTGCESLNPLDRVVYVSTTPSFTASTDPQVICVDGEALVVGSVTPTPYNNTPTVDFGDGIYIPDNEGCFQDTLTINGYDPGATIQDISEIESLYASLEHTYLTDITIAFICPNGSVLSVYSQQGVCGDVDLGEPVPADDGAPGDGIVYTWTPDTTYPTLAEACSDPDYTFDGTDSGNNLIAANYASEDPWENLIGCPFNGPWIIQVCDIVGADDGWIFEWGVTFNAEEGSIPLSFTPSFGTGCDSTYWSGNFIDNADPLCDSIWVVPTEGGTQTYTYNAIDNFGCLYTDSIDVIVIPKPDANAGEDVWYCGSNINLEGTVENGVPNQNYAYSWSPAELFNNPNTQNPVFVAGIDTVTTVYMTTYWTEDENCSATDSLNVNLPLLPLTGDLERMFPCTFELPYTVFTTEQNQTGVTYQWSFTNSDTTIVDFGNDPSAVYDQAGTFTVVYFEPNCGLSVSQEIIVTPQVCEILIPNIMTPNGDGDNDSFNVAGISFFDGSLLQVYNRWGNIVHEDPDYNGKWAATEVADGTYYYILTVNENGQEKKYSGSLTIVR